MGICGEEKTHKENQLCVSNEYISLDLSIKVSKSISKITSRTNEEYLKGIGFFMRLFPNNAFKCLIVYNVISEKLIGKSIEVEIHNKEKTLLLLDMNIRYIKLFKDPYNIAVIQITNEDFDIIDNVVFLDFDSNFSKVNEQHKNLDIFTLGYPLGDEDNVVYGSGKICTMKNSFEFEHNIPTNIGFSGAPVISLESFKIIGVHKYHETLNNLNVGVFIGFIVEDLKNDSYIHQLKEEQNYIIGKIDIKEKDLNKEISIICSYEEYKRKHPKDNSNWNDENCNEEEIKQCIIEIDKLKIPFSYYYKFSKVGKYFIKYSFENNLINMSYMFYGCSSLIYLNLSNFDTSYSINMSHMFHDCSSLLNLNLSNLDTENVSDMSYMFSDCKYLPNINLSNFDTKKVTNMSSMFSGCTTMENINLSNFDTENVQDMSDMFAGNIGLRKLNLSNFDTTNVSNMKDMFCICFDLLDKDIITKDNKIIEELKNEKKKTIPK